MIDQKSNITSKPVFYHPELDVLRFFAFLTVFASHVMPRSPDFYMRNHLPHRLAQFLGDAAWAGISGVVLFFILSSYLITTLLLREYDRMGRIDVIAFYKRRALRIWPLYFAFLALCVFVAPLVGLPKMPWVHAAGFATFTENWVLVMFFQHAPETPAMPLWSLCVEEQFYLVWPLLIMVMGVRRLWIAGLACIPLAIISRLHMSHSGFEVMLTNSNPEGGIWITSTSHLDSIAVGALIACVYRQGIPPVSTWLRVGLIAGGLAVPIIVREGVLEVWRYPAVTIAGAAILIGVIGFDLPKNRFWSAITYLGKISFGLYVLHAAFIVYFDYLHPKVLFVAPAAFACTIITAAASYRWLEMPFLRMKERFAIIHSRTP